ncbi:hypothetical protein KUTeg_009540 [Tegillarca granosa]|uniref:Uncharacterized protein n=1 Tax=Tegillarca granosa TaxID=220873 RepID=A0ABQ9F7B4_TEGGR|nr:hypothetical protein KUTeg_009540 [Tegillarca granosa]
MSPVLTVVVDVDKSKGEGLLISDGPLWERSRRLLTPAFHFEILRKYFPVYNSVAEVFMTRIWEEAESGKSVEFFQYVSKATLDTILRCSMSYVGNVQDKKNVHPYVDAVNSLSHLLWKRMLSPFKYPDFIYQLTSEGRENQRHCKSVHEFTEAVIKKRRKELESGQIVQNRHPDFLDILLTAKDDSGVGFTDLEIRNEVDTFTFEGHDTTASAISWIIYALGKYEDEQERVFKEIKSVLGDKDEVSWSDVQELQLLTCFIKESMRFYSPVPLVARLLRKPLIIDGVEIPCGPRVDINIYCIHHNPEVWPDHMVFKPERFDRSTQDRHPFAFVPFSAGPRNCIGQTFAMDEIKVITAKLIKRFIIKLDPDHQTDILPDVVTRATSGIKIIFQKRYIDSR